MRRSQAALTVVFALVISFCGDSNAQLNRSEPWDLVFTSDSFGFGVAPAWAGRIEEAEGVEVRLHDHTKDVLTPVLGPGVVRRP